MTGSEGTAAGDVFVADFERRSSGLLHGVRIVGAFVAHLSQGLLPSPAVHDVVVRRRDDGTEVARVPVEDPELPGDTLRFVQAGLAADGPEEFVAGWGPRS